VSYDGEPSTSLRGEGYATALPRRPRQPILLVNERTLLPVLMPLAPSATALPGSVQKSLPPWPPFVLRRRSSSAN
jgi:hypothetical protein